MKLRLHPTPLVVLLFLSAVRPAFAERALHWRALDVTARLDANGALHVVERHAMVFTGDWNGGERVFRVASGQHLSLESVRRLDPLTGAAVELVGGDVDFVDHYKFTDGTLRWRSRMPSNPPFSNTQLVYEIAYTLDRVLLKGGDVYTLDHNFALPDARQMIQAFSIELDLDPAWVPPPNFVRRRSAGPLPPGSNYTVRVDLRHTGAAMPLVMRYVATPPMQLLLFGILLVATGAIGTGFVRRESALGRFAAPPPVGSIDAAWLQQHVFDLPAEHVGALWDESVGGPEVSALLARLTAEKKIESWSQGGELSLRLLRPIDSFSGYEAALLRGLFFDGRTETSTKAVKDHYATTGFDPAATIKADLLKVVAAHAESQETAPSPSARLTFALFGSAFALALFAVFDGDVETSAVMWAVLPLAILWLIGIIAGVVYQTRVERLGRWASSFAFVPVFFLASAAVAIGSRESHPPVLLAALLLLQIAIVNNIFNVAKTRQGARTLARRRQLASARQYFAQELQQARPRLEDAWFPWLVAFGLTADVDRWFFAHGPSPSPTDDDTRWMVRDRDYMATSSYRSSWGGSSFMGGGLSGGAGASGTWGTAAEGLAVGVPVSRISDSGDSSGSSDSGDSSYSSDSSDGGSSGSSGSSGGGGGGGW